jgi:hypothetical protein
MGQKRKSVFVCRESIHGSRGEFDGNGLVDDGDLAPMLAP